MEENEIFIDEIKYILKKNNYEIGQFVFDKIKEQKESDFCSFNYIGNKITDKIIEIISDGIDKIY